ncbi:MAG: hypothetical protein O7D92_06045 [Proteobacteria bacterium]|jgi:hypothetical protein|nr:hypothetical protein [Pseudomonadota bacterium]
MRIKSLIGGLALMFLASPVFADLEPWTDYEVSDAVWLVTTVKVDANMGDAYLEGIKQTWAASNEVAKELGQIEEYSIFRSDLENSGSFNLLLIIKFANTADLAPNKERYEAFIDAWGQANADASTDYAQKNYPGMRELTGEYMMREITLK